ncbi:MAG: flagellar motor protein MotB [Saprospiraceae bacterium]|nr:flagellar motor protein MotB [Candidatus Opimibacter iunctus]
MKNNVSLILLAGISLSAMSCVSSKKFEQVNTELNQLRTLTSEQEEIISFHEKELAASEAKNKTLAEENSKMKKDMAGCTEAKAVVQQKLEAINGAIKEQYGSLQQLSDKVKVSLEKFDAAGIDVEFVSGLVHLSMDNYLMFTSGGTTVGWEGKQALAAVAEVVNGYPGTSIYVIGNTDNTPAASAAKDNWDFSTTRANAVVRVLTREYKVDPTRIISGGRAEFHPVADNTTEEGKGRNRRVDIYINPNLDRLWKAAETIK